VDGTDFTEGTRNINPEDSRESAPTSKGSCMQTYSHFLMTAALSRQLSQRQISVSTGAFLMGSVLPDVPFTLLTLVYETYYLWISPLAPSQTWRSVMEYLHFDLFYRDPVWIVGDNFFHAPLILLVCGLAGWGLRLRWRWGNALLWLARGAGLHTLVDIFTHHSDGPLIFFPLNWSYRFGSPISYWEAGYYARIVSPVEHTLDLLFLVYLFRAWWRQRSGKVQNFAAKEQS
jgi:hypothetical protein